MKLHFTGPQTSLAIALSPLLICTSAEVDNTNTSNQQKARLRHHNISVIQFF